MKERVYRFGPQRSLVGIYTEPSPDEMIPDAPLAVILNAGIVHHIGPFRLHVDLARRLADAGFRTLRLDLSGLGDSGLRAGKMDASQRALLDVRDALDFLQQHHGVQRFVVMGLCKKLWEKNATMDMITMILVAVQPRVGWRIVAMALCKKVWEKNAMKEVTTLMIICLADVPPSVARLMGSKN